jgi:sec1 family domain-containing protein 1
MATHQQSLRDRQVGRPYETSVSLWLTDRFIASIEKILNLNHEAPESSTSHDATSSNGLIPQSTPILNPDGDPIWKVLVFDDLGRDVISSVLRVNDLRSWGVTIHL